MTDLLKYRHKVRSQNGEDGIIERIFQIMPPVNKWCVEVGAMNGVRNSNTYNLITAYQWSSVQIEASRRWFGELVNTHNHNQSVYCIHARIGFSRRDSMDRLLSSTPIPSDFDLLSLDIDGYDYHVWDAMNKYRPRVVIVEFNPSIPDYVSYIQQKGEVNQGSSLKAITDLGERKGYELICTLVGNAFYVSRDCFGLFGIDDNSIGALWRDRTYHTNVFQLFDGRLMISGCNKFAWNNRPEELSILDGRTNESIETA